MSHETVKALIVDDDSDLLDIFSFYLEEVGYEVQKASGGEEAWRLIQENQFHLVISDQQMPLGSGLELLDRMKRAKPELPFALFFNDNDYSKIADAYGRGADRLLTKPISAEQLQDAAKFLVVDMRERWKEQGSPQARSPVQNLELRAGIEQIGRGGLALKVPSASMLAPDRLLGFCIKVEGPTPFDLKGQGRIKWLSVDPKDASTCSIGIEFDSLTPDSFPLLLDFLRLHRPKPYIPNLIKANA